MTVSELFMIIWAFICDNWQLILIIVLNLFALIISAFRKKVKVVDSVWAICLRNLPHLIRIAEDKVGPGNGREKREMVFDSIINLIVSITDLTALEAVDKYGAAIYSAIENILTTPQKKE